MIRRLLDRYRTGLGQLVKFAVVGGSGVIVNFVVAYLAKKLAPAIWPGAEPNGVVWPIPGTAYSIRWFMLYSMLAFIVANLSNYQLNRMWTFRSRFHARWLRELVPFFVVGLIAQSLGMVLEWGLMNPTSPIALPSSVFDDSTGLRTMWYWAHAIMVVVTIPISFVLNKFWTFKAIRGDHPEAPAADPPAGGEA